MGFKVQGIEAPAVCLNYAEQQGWCVNPAERCSDARTEREDRAPLHAGKQLPLHATLKSEHVDDMWKAH